MYTDASREAIKQFLLDNVDELLENGTLKAHIIELKSALDDGHSHINGWGYDQQCEKTGHKIEVKYTSTIKTGKTLRVLHLWRKEGLFDFLKIIDGVHNRTFVIPHDVVFNNMRFTDGGVYWSASYNETDYVQPHNTEILLKYEVFPNA